MTFERRDPDDPDAQGEPTAADIDAAFAQIVAGWDNEGRSRWSTDQADVVDPVAELPTEELPAARFDEPLGDADGPPHDTAVLDTTVDDYEDLDDHFEPPEPPPLPRPQPATLGAGALFVLGIVLLTMPGLIGFSSQYGLPLGLLAITGAIVWLGARLRQGPPTDSGWDDGAQV